MSSQLTHDATIAPSKTLKSCVWALHELRTVCTHLGSKVQLLSHPGAVEAEVLLRRCAPVKCLASQCKEQKIRCSSSPTPPTTPFTGIKVFLLRKRKAGNYKWAEQLLQLLPSKGRAQDPGWMGTVHDPAGWEQSMILWSRLGGKRSPWSRLDGNSPRSRLGGNCLWFCDPGWAILQVGVSFWWGYCAVMVGVVCST